MTTKIKLWGNMDVRWQEDLEGVALDVVAVSALQVVDANEERVVH